jgi:hypothetical protein
MGRQGGIARFTGSVGNINCYFDAGIEVEGRSIMIEFSRLAFLIIQSTRIASIIGFTILHLWLERSKEK